MTPEAGSGPDRSEGDINLGDRRAAWQLGEKLRYRHFVVPETASAPRARSGSLLEVVRFAADAPDWLYQQMNRVSRVALTEGSLVVNSSQGGGVKDTWVLAE